jgi:quercetin dioxygenase-like cupin family protein
MDAPNTSDRLRAHPRDRFSGTQHVFELAHEIENLRSEAHEGRDGHRQKSLFHRAGVTQVLFAFDAGGEMREHSARGLVTILCLQGALEVEAAGEKHTLQAPASIVLDADVPHSVRAPSEAAMLLTVHLQNN